MNLVSNEIESYSVAHSSPMSELLQYVERQTYLKTLQPHMISGPTQGAFLGHIAQMLQAKNVLEIGTFTGYTTLCIAEQLPTDGQITTIEVNPESHHLANSFFEKFQHPERIDSILGDAKEVIKELDKSWDLVLIDAGKKDNYYFFDALVPKVRKGGYLLVDNVIWKGKTLHKNSDKVTASIDYFNKQILEDTRVKVTLLPLRDGISLIQKL